jgi:hypothetical protein
MHLLWKCPPCHSGNWGIPLKLQTRLMTTNPLINGTLPTQTTVEVVNTVHLALLVQTYKTSSSSSGESANHDSGATLFAACYRREHPDRCLRVLLCFIWLIPGYQLAVRIQGTTHTARKHRSLVTRTYWLLGSIRHNKYISVTFRNHICSWINGVTSEFPWIHSHKPY